MTGTFVSCVGQGSRSAVFVASGDSHIHATKVTSRLSVLLLACAFVTGARADSSGNQAQCIAAPVQYSVTPIGEPFDPSRCKSGRKGFLYWAARQEVFAFPYDGARKVYPSASVDPLYQQGIPAAADPTEPPGCFSNPMRGGELPLIQWHAMDSFCKVVGRPMNLLTNLVHIWQGYRSIAASQFKDDQNAFNKKYFIAGAHCINRKSGVVQCEIRGSNDPIRHQVNYVLKIPKDLVSATSAMSSDLYVVLSNDIAASVSPENGMAVRSSFDLYGAVRLRDSFRLSPDEVDLLVPYYRDLIAYVVDAHVPGYVWTSSNNKQ